jgi:type I restriction enzyme S subunit
LAEQRAIAGVLGALDDKMELNRRMNETLEAIAKAEFRRMMEEGGETGTLGDIAENPKRAVDPSEIDAQTPYIGLEHMPRRSIALGEWGTAGDLESGKARFHRGEILFGKLRPYFHKVGVAPLDGVCSTDILTIVPKKPAWFGLVLGHLSSKELIDHTDACSTGTKMPRASWSDIARYEIALPPEPVAAKLTGMIQPLVERIIANIHESQTLAGLRDALLPKLLSGAVRVRAEERAEMVAANRVSSESARQAQHDSVKRPA